jgi:DNA-binding SARP family transcriptional activator/tetratricopeptide (TPR) repeat protein
VPIPPDPRFRLRLRGLPEVVGDGGRSGALGAPDALLLAWLALEGATARERLAGLLWPGSSADAARNALRQRLFRLRRMCGGDVVTGATMLALADGVAHDLEDGATLLGDLAAPECPELDAWLAARRAATRAAARRHSEAQIEKLEAAGDAHGALPLAMALLDEDPLSESAHRRVMRLHYLRGDRAAAMLAFDRCERLLKHEVGTRPSAATLALLQTVESGAAVSPATPAWRAAVPASVLRPPRLIGRDAELSALRRGWRAGSVVLVTGEAGMGKSRLLQALSSGPAGESGGVVIAAGRPGDALVPYGSFSRLLREVAARAPQALDESARQRLVALLPGIAPPPSGPPPARRPALLGAVREFLQRARGAFDGLVFDDVHFADDASIELLQSLLAGPREGDPLRWCLGLRPPLPGSRLRGLVDALAAAAPLTQVPMLPLDVAEVAELVDSLALDGVSGERIAAALRQRSGGNPLFALETLKLAWTEGAFAEGGELPRPQSLAQLIGQQLARLGASALMLARVAAVAGTDFSLPLAEKVLGSSALHLADAWHELEMQQVMIGTEFAHDLIFEAVLAGVPAVIARHLHGEIAALLEAGAGEPAHVAAHWEAAGRRERALPSLRAAAERAHDALRERERIDFLLRAADIAEATGERELSYDCLSRAVETHMNSIRDADGLPLLDRLDVLATTPAQRARSLGQRAWYSSQLADNSGAVRIGEQALALAEPLGDRTLIGQIRQRLATALAMLGRFDEALAHLQAVQGWADDHLAPEDRAEFHGNFAVVLDNLGRPEAARQHHRRAIDASLSSGDHAQRATQLANHAVNRLNAGDVRRAGALVQQAQQLMTTYSLQGSSAGFVTVLQMQCARAEGRYAEALDCADHAQAILQASNPARLPVVHLHRGHVWLDLGQHARARQELHAAGAGDPLPLHFEARRLLLLARVQRLLGQETQALLLQAHQAAPPNGWPEVRMLVELESALALPVAEALALLDDVRRRAAALGLRGTVLAALLRMAGVATEADAARAAAAAQAAVALAGEVEPTLAMRAEVWLQAARGLRAAGEDDSAVLRAGVDWVRATAAKHVAAMFREAFLQRNPVVRDLLALAA